MADVASPITEESVVETAEVAFRRVARRKLLERGCPESQLEARIAHLLRKGLPIDPKLLDGP